MNVLPDPLSRRAEAAAARLLLDATTAHITAELTRAGVDNLVLKGPSFARWLYESHLDRPYGDTDLLISPTRVPEAEKALIDLGFERAARPLTGDRPWTSIDWRSPSDGAIVDLHQALMGVTAEPLDAWRVLWPRRELIPLPGGDVHVLDPPSRLLHLCLHAVQHGEGQPLVDLRRALSTLSADVWLEACDIAVAIGATDAFAAGLRLDREGEAMSLRLGLPATRSVEVELRARNASGTSLFFDWLHQAGRVRDKALLLTRKFFPPPDYMRSWFPPARKGLPWLVAGYLYRPLALIRKGVPGFIAWRQARKAVKRGP